LSSFVTQRWRGRIGWRTLFWRAPQRPAVVLGVSVFWL